MTSIEEAEKLEAAFVDWRGCEHASDEETAALGKLTRLLGNIFEPVSAKQELIDFIDGNIDEYARAQPGSIGYRVKKQWDQALDLAGCLPEEKPPTQPGALKELINEIILQLASIGADDHHESKNLVRILNLANQLQEPTPEEHLRFDAERTDEIVDKSFKGAQ